ncbi:hypothetical protein [Zavarzinella formosa]|uniref:hypothetical protein n=1 Tax=Zavarzinella formosa TaxID=360055 RepID=UPI0012F860A0|nr:hypothetical protein [Zavarzinella formosa]
MSELLRIPVKARHFSSDKNFRSASTKPLPVLPCPERPQLVLDMCAFFQIDSEHFLKAVSVVRQRKTAEWTFMNAYKPFVTPIPTSVETPTLLKTALMVWRPECHANICGVFSA